MKLSRVQIMNRVMATLLSLLVLVSYVPITVFAASAAAMAPAGFTVTVQDDSENPLTDVIVAYTIAVEGQTPITGSATTTIDGKAVIPEIAGLADKIQAQTPITITYTASLTGYGSVTKTDDVTALNQNVVIEIITLDSDDAILSVTKNNGGTVTLNNDSIYPLKVSKNDYVNLNIQASTDYFIKSVVIDETARSLSSLQTDFYESIHVTSNVDIKVVFESKKATLTVTKAGTGTVSVNGSQLNSGDTVQVDKYTDFNLSVQPGTDYYIKSITVGNTNLTVTNKASFSQAVKVTDNVTITVTFIKQYYVDTPTSSEGVIKLQGDIVQNGKHYFDENSPVTLNIVPNAGYQIDSVKIGDAKQTITDYTSFSIDLTMDAHKIITVTFIQVSTITVKYDNAKGTVTSTPNFTSTTTSTDVPPITSGIVTVKTTESVNITATPLVNYRISQIKINDQTINYSDNTYTSLNAYTNSLPANQNYTIIITFAPILIDVYATAESLLNGAVEISVPRVEYGNNTAVKVIPNVGYSVASILVNGKPVNLNIEQRGERSFELTNIIETQEIVVTYSALESIVFPNFKIEAKKDNLTVPAIRQDTMNKIFVFPKDSKVTMSPTNTAYGIGLFRSLSYYPYYEGVGNWNFPTSVDIYSTLTIDYVGLVNVQGWRLVQDITPSHPMKIVIDNTAPDVSLTATTQPNTNGYYNGDVSFTMEATDPGDYSGIGRVEYKVTSDDIETQSKSLVLMNNGSPSPSYSGELIIDSSLNNSDVVKVEITVFDLAGNSKKVSKTIKINTTPPIVEVSVDGTPDMDATVGYYNNLRTATITITDRNSCFSESTANGGINIYAVDINGNKIEIDKNSMISDWVEVEGKHTATILFSKDAHYTWSIVYTSKSMLPSVYAPVSAPNPYDFTIDKAAPTGTITVDTETWNNLLSTLTFGVWKNYSVSATAVGLDTISPIYAVQYYKTSSDTKLTGSDLETLFTDKKFSTDLITVNADERFTIYARITDYAGNTLYISTNGLIVDMTAGLITLTPSPANSRGIHNTDVSVAITVNEEAIKDQAYSGINKISYKVIKDGKVDKPTQEGNLFTFEVDNPTYAQLEGLLTDTINIDKNLNNSDNVQLIVTVTDNAKNEYSQTVDLKINIDSPAIHVQYDNNAYETISNGHGYFSSQRTATITINDRASAFDEAAATNGIEIKAKDANGADIVLDTASMISDWTSVGDTHTATVSFTADGNYTVGLSYLSGAGNTNALVDYGSSVTPTNFTVDSVKPTGSVTIANNTWNQILNILTFGIYSNTTLEVTATAQDINSPVTIEYYKTSNPIAMTIPQLEQCVFLPFQVFSVDADEQFVVYLRISDYAGNVSYINSDGCIVDMQESQIQLTPNLPNENKVYKADVNVDVKVTDSEPYSGIRTVDYWVVKNGDTANPTQEGNLYTFAVQDPTQADLKSEWTGSVKVDSLLNNSCNVVLFVKTVDNAGNEMTESIPLDIDTSAPAIQVSYDNNADFGGNTYFDEARTATIVITERAHHFDAASATKGIVITAVDGSGNPISDAYVISGWQTAANPENPDATTHTATIKFVKDANYTFAISYTDKAGNLNSKVNPLGSIAPFDFTVDTVKPSGEVTAASAEGRTTLWDDLVRTLTFGYFSNQKITITNTSFDATSPIESVQLHKEKSSNATDKTTALTVADLDLITDWTAFNGLEILPNEQATVYIKITDMAGNVTYISTNGLIVDDKKPLAEALAPDITLTPQQPVNGIYRGNVNVSICIDDPLTNGSYSGLKEVSYKVFDKSVSSTEPTQSGVLYTFNVTDPKQPDLLKTWSGSIVVDSTKNNSNDIEIVVYAIDNAGNSSENKVAVKIDTTAPTIDISYDNNRVDNGSLFKENRVATIVVTERNFDAADLKVLITNTDGTLALVSAWTKVAGTGNLDNTKWTATVTYAADGDYTFAINYTDFAGNPCAGSNYVAGTVAGASFTIDKTVPTVTVSYDNNSAVNTNYYKAKRTATIVIVEHNFQTDRVKIALSATDDGTSITLPVVSSWTSNGDRHTATVTYAADAAYSFDIDVTDKAGNLAADFTKQTFYVDTTTPSLSISGVKNLHAYSGDVIPVITYSDTNYDSKQVLISLSGANRKAVSLDGMYTEIHNGNTFTFDNFAKEKEVDDIYTLTATLTDKAGNSANQTMTFSVNRFGSTYVLGAALEKIVGSFARDPQDIVLTETNPTNLKNIKVTLFKNDATIILIEGEDYSIEETGGNGEWYQYTYTVFSKNFADDGVYRIVIHSEDAAGNVAENTLDTKDKEITFGIDKTTPNILVANLSSGTTYAVEKLLANISVSDNLRLATVTITLDGNVYKTWTGEELDLLVAEGGNISFTINGDSLNAHNVKIICRDSAGNETTKEMNDFYVTTNLWVRYYNNKLLFFGSIGGGFLLIAAITLLIVFKKRRA